MIDNFKQLLETSDSILITTHLGADPDAVCSGLLLAKTLGLNYPSKKVNLVAEEVSYGLDFIDGFNSIKKSPLGSAIAGFKPDLLIILDANNLARCTRNPVAAKDALNGANTIIIDHHEPDDKDKSDVYIHQNSPAVTQDIYDICFDQLGMKKPPGYAEVAMTGLYSDTAGFVHLTDDYEKTFKIVMTLIKDGASIEGIHSNLHQYSSSATEVLAELLAKTSPFLKFSYSFITDEYAASKPANEIKQGIDIYVNDYVRNIDGRKSGFVVYKDLNSQKGEYKVSFRSLPGLVDVASIAKKLGGGGHKPSAGASFEAADINDALSKVKQAISEN